MSTTVFNGHYSYVSGQVEVQVHFTESTNYPAGHEVGVSKHAQRQFFESKVNPDGHDVAVRVQVELQTHLTESKN